MNQQTTDNKTEQNHPMDWHKLSKYGVLTSKLFLLLFLLCISATLTFKCFISPYSYFIFGIEISIVSIIVFNSIRMSTFRRKEKEFEIKDHLENASEQIKRLWNNLDFEIDKYEEGSNYYFRQVRFYKHSIILLSGISTIILGLDLGGIKIGIMNYPTFAKNAALFIGAIITAFTSLTLFWNYEKYWITNKTITNSLRALRDELEYALVSKSLDNNTIEKIEKKFADIKETFNKYWESALSERNSQKRQDI